MVKPTDQETTAIDKSLLPTVPKRRGCHATQGLAGGPRAVRSEGKAWARAFTAVSVDEAGQMSWAGLGWVGWDNFGGRWL